MNIYQKLKATLQLRKAIEMADNAHDANGDRYYVMPSEDGKLIVMDRLNFRRLKQKGYITRKAHVVDLLQECFYYTPDKRGIGVMTPKEIEYRRKNFFDWMDYNRRMTKEAKKALKKRNMSHDISLKNNANKTKNEKY